jgi:hypothetical protein
MVCSTRIFANYFGKIKGKIIIKQQLKFNILNILYFIII